MMVNSSAQNKRSAEYSALNRTSISSSKAQTSSMEGGRGKKHKSQKMGRSTVEKGFGGSGRV